MRLLRASLALLPVVLTLTVPPASAEDPAFVLTLKDHKFTPAELTVPANVRVKLTIRNQDATPAEFESHDFKAEKVVAGGREVSLTIGPLKPGTYGFFDDYHEKDARGRLIAQ
jgi:heme/copper-type cytochrome/quinol oxidase subunit 2